ncbi:hypothetical protein Lal_00027665 [Lupinus albus]|uniref:Putative 5'-nucleotidase n=1 Tax=Lupinus albus TaxID=3870 RepID=A0A6A5MK49_LUPAL|nr:putative 5'-nucleotidase [Lupinus albus]KAF1873627.1 hypothetical protein Lal_00027665 [Lupinus albus]
MEEEKKKATILITNDDGINGDGIRALVKTLAETNEYNIYVCAPDSEKSCIGHCITWLNPINVKPLHIDGTISSFSVSGSPADCTSLGISQTLFPTLPDLVISGINNGDNTGYDIFYSGTVAGAREAFFNHIPSISISYYRPDWAEGMCKLHDFILAAQVCIPIISAVLIEIKNQTYPPRCFLNINVPNIVANHKGYKLTKQGKSICKMGWKQVTTETEGRKMSSNRTNIESEPPKTNGTISSVSPEHLLFVREVVGSTLDDDDDDDDTEYRSLQEGYITVTPLAALSDAEFNCQTFFKEWLRSVSELSSSSAL